MSIMTTEMQALARRAVACKRWRLLPGMRLVVGQITVRLLWVDGGLWLAATDGGVRIYCTDDDWLPDLADPATLGCLLALLREALGDEGLHVQPYRTRGGLLWEAHTASRGYGPTEAHALVGALEAAP